MSHDQQKPETPAPTGRLLGNAVTSYVRFGVSMACMLLLTPFVIRSVGTEDYGLWSLALCLVGYFELLECGLATSTVKYMAEFSGRDDGEGRNRLAGTLLAAYLVIAAVVAALAIVVALQFTHWFSIPADRGGKATAVLLLLSARLVVSLPLSLFVGVLFGGERISLLNAIKTVSTVAAALGVWIVLSAGCGLIGQAAVVAGVVIVEHVVYLAACRRAFPELRVSLRSFDAGMLRMVAGFALCALVTNLAAVILFRTDPIVISTFLSLTAVAIYALALKISEQLALLTKQLINVFSPRLAELYGAGRREPIRHLLLASSKFALAATLALVVPLALFATRAVTLWVGPEFSAAGPILVILLGAVVCKVLQEAAANVLGMTGFHRFVAIAALAAAAANLGLTLLLVRPLGLVGVAAATLISTAVVGVGVVVRRACRTYDVAGRDFLGGVIAPMLMPVALQSTICLFFMQQEPPRTLTGFAIIVLLAVMTFAAAFWTWSLSAEERKQLQIQLCARWHALSAARRKAMAGDGKITGLEQAS